MPLHSGIRAASPSAFLVALLAALLAGPPDLHAQAATPPPSWVLVAQFLETWDSNAALQEGPGEPGLVHSLGLSFSHARTGPRGRLSLAGAGSALIYDANKDLNAFNYTVSGEGSLLLSPRVSVTLGQELVSSYRYSGPLVGDSTELLPLVLTRLSATRAGLSIQLSARTTLSAQGGYTYVSFDSPSLTSGSVLLGGASLTRRISTRDSLTLSYEAQQSRTQGNTTALHTIDGGWSRVLKGSLTAQVSAGANYYLYLASTGVVGDWSYYAAASLEKRLRRSSLAARYSHTISPAFGLGEDRVADSVGAVVNLALSRKLNLLADASYGRSRDPVFNDLLYDTQSAGAALEFRPTRRLTTRAGYSYRSRKDEVTAATLTSNEVFLSLSSGWQWR